MLQNEGEQPSAGLYVALGMAVRRRGVEEDQLLAN